MHLVETTAGLAWQLYRQLWWTSKQIGSCSYRYLQLCFSIRSDLENSELDLQRKKKVLGLVWPISCNNAEGDPQKADCALWVMVQTVHNNSNGGMWRKKPTVPYGSSYKQSTTTISGSILTQTRLTVAGRPKHHTINAQQYNGTIWTKKLTVPYGSSYKESTTRFRWTILTQTGLFVAGRPKPQGSS